MVKFIPVQCQNYKYPPIINSQIQERSANFFRETIDKTELPYISLHTDHPKIWFGKPRNKVLSSEFLKEFPSILLNMYDSGNICFSKLWCDDEKWSKDFSSFLVRLTKGIEPENIKIIEIHPPFEKYCNSLEDFVKRYVIFEEEVLKKFPAATICIENRYNNSKTKKYGNFILSTKEDIINLTKLISDFSLKLKLVVDIPQLFSEHYGDELISEEWMIQKVLTPLKEIRAFIASTHIWGKTIKGVHNADLNTYFRNKNNVKKCFLKEIYQLFNDDTSRYFLPELYSGNDEMSAEDSIMSIVNDFKEEGIEFV